MSREWSIRDAKAAALAESRALRTDPPGPATGGWRWPLAPLLEACARPDSRRPDPFSTAADAGPPDPFVVLARRLGLDTAAVRRAAVDGLSDAQADRWAVRAGWHPANIWGWDAWTATGLDRHRVAHLVPEASRIAMAITDGGRRVRKHEVIAALRARGVILSHPRGNALWQRLQAALPDAEEAA